MRCTTPQLQVHSTVACVVECIQDFIATHHRKPYVLDIGCGTGLLSLQAARAGAERVYGCEMFRSWADVARKNVTENGFDGVITIINKNSRDLVVKGDDDSPYGIH